MSAEGLAAAAEQDLSPVWVPDDGAAVCMHCRKTQFTVLNRRVGLSFCLVSFFSALMLFVERPACNKYCHDNPQKFTYW